MQSSIKNILPRYLKSGLITGGGKVHDELRHLWRLMKKPMEQPSESLTPGSNVQLLVFSNYKAAALWEYLAMYRIPIDRYAALFRCQHGYDFQYQPPKCIAARCDNGADIALDDELYRRLESQYIVSDYERARGWCFLCRGTGYIMKLPEGRKLIESNIPVIPYRLRCPYHKSEPEKASIAKRPDIMGVVGR